MEISIEDVRNAIRELDEGNIPIQRGRRILVLGHGGFSQGDIDLVRAECLAKFGGSVEVMTPEQALEENYISEFRLENIRVAELSPFVERRIEFSGRDRKQEKLRRRHFKK